MVDPKTATPTKKQGIGTGAGLEKYEQYVVRLNMAARATTRPGGRDNEGYATSANVISFFRQTKAPSEMIETLNGQVGWHLGGTPNEIVWYFPAGKVKPGMSLQCKCEWKNATPHSSQPNYRYNLEIVLPE